MIARRLQYAACFLAMLGTWLVSLDVAAQQIPGGKRVALLVGVNKYLKPGLNDLSYPEADVTAMAQELGQHGFATNVLLGSDAGDKQATRENILATARRMVSNLGKEDLALVMLSGHGQQMSVNLPGGGDKDDGFFVPLEGNSADPQSLVSLSELVDDILAPNVGRRLLLVDACRNTRKDPSRGAKGIQGRVIALPEDTAVLFSCRAGQQSFESDELKHGLFTHCLLSGLRGEAARGGLVAWDGLVAHVTDQMASDDIRKHLPQGMQQDPIPAGGVGRLVLARVENRPVANNTPPATNNTAPASTPATVPASSEKLFVPDGFPPGTILNPEPMAVIKPWEHLNQDGVKSSLPPLGASPLVGRWNLGKLIYFSGLGFHDEILTLEVNDGKVTGKVTVGFESSTIDSGTIRGNEFHFIFKSYPGVAGVREFRGMVNGDSIEGAIQGVSLSGEKMPFKAKRLTTRPLWEFP